MSEGLEVVETRQTWWFYLITIAIPSRYMPRWLCPLISKYGIWVRFRDMPWTRAGYMGSQAAEVVELIRLNMWKRLREHT